MTTIIFNDVAFNADQISKGSEADFIKGHTGQKVDVKDEDGKVVKKDHQSTDLNEAELKQVYALAIGAVKGAPRVDPVKPDVKVIAPPKEEKPVEQK